MNKEEIEYCLKQFYKNKQGFRFENGLKISMYKVFEQLENLQQRIDKIMEIIELNQYSYGYQIKDEILGGKE